MNKVSVYDGYVEYVAHMGSDELISQIAGISHASDEGPGVDKLLEWDHVSPLEFGQIIFKLKLPIFVGRQLFRHRVFTFMEQSGRYTDMSDSLCYWPEKPLPQDETMDAETTINRSYRLSRHAYGNLLAMGVPRELARIVLPLGLYTQCYVRMDVRHLRDFLKLRLDSHAQTEMQEYAKAIRDIALQYFPVALEGL